MLAGDVVTVSGDTTARAHLGKVAALVRRRMSGGYVAASEHGFQLLNERLGIDHEITVFEGAGLRMTTRDRVADASTDWTRISPCTSLWRQ